MLDLKDIISYLEQKDSTTLHFQIEEWINLNEFNKSKFNFIKTIWEESKRNEGYVEFDTSLEWDVFKDFLAERKKKIIQQEKNSSKKGKLSKNNLDQSAAHEITNWKNISSVVIALLIIIGSNFFFWPPLKYLEISYAEKDMNLILDDGSSVEIKKGAFFKTLQSYKYSKIRAIEFNGEANFEIIQNLDKPFTVETKNTSLTGVGAIFKLNTKGKQSIAEIKEGEIRFYPNSDHNDYIELSTGDKYNYDGLDFINLKSSISIPDSILSH